MPTCQQCDKPALYRVQVEGGEVFLCLTCTQAMQSLEAEEQRGLMAQMNLVAGMINAQVGMDLVPQVQVPPPSNRVGPMSFHSLNFNQSQVGVLNFGSIKKVDQALVAINSEGNTDVGSAIRSLTEGVGAADIDNAKKEQIFQLLSGVAEEAARPEQERRNFLVHPLLQELSGLFEGIAAISDLWTTYGPTVGQFFQ